MKNRSWFSRMIARGSVPNSAYTMACAAIRVATRGLRPLTMAGCTEATRKSILRAARVSAFHCSTSKSAAIARPSHALERRDEIGRDALNVADAGEPAERVFERRRRGRDT